MSTLHLTRAVRVTARNTVPLVCVFFLRGLTQLCNRPINSFVAIELTLLTLPCSPSLSRIFPLSPCLHVGWMTVERSCRASRYSTAANGP